MELQIFVCMCMPSKNRLYTKSIQKPYRNTHAGEVIATFITHTCTTTNTQTLDVCRRRYVLIMYIWYNMDKQD